MNKIDITSTAVEKSIDMLKDFLNKLIGPAVEETGLLVKDKVSYYRFKNQLSILKKSKAIIEGSNIKVKPISLKLLIPFLEYASLEDNEELQDRWAILLSNLVDSEQSIENHVFPYILSQLSSEEYQSLQSTYESKTLRLDRGRKELEEYKKTKFIVESKYAEQISDLNLELNAIRKKYSHETAPISIKDQFRDLNNKVSSLSRLLSDHSSREQTLEDELSPNEVLYDRNLKIHHLSNINRLGLIKNKILPKATLDYHRIANNKQLDYIELEDVEIDVDLSEEKFILSELGELFIQTCNRKEKIFK